MRLTKGGGCHIAADIDCIGIQASFKTVEQEGIDCPRRGSNNRQALRDASRFLIGEAGLRCGGNGQGLTLRVREKRKTRVMLRLRLFVAW